MKRKPTAYRIVQAFILILIVMLLPITVWAQETTLTAVVPSSHTLHIELTGEGTIVVDGVAYTKTADVQIQRQSQPKIAVQIADGYKIKSVFWGSEDVTTAIQNGKWTAPEITEDAVLTVTLERVGSVPATGDTVHFGLWLTILMFSLFGLTICLLRSKKEIA